MRRMRYTLAWMVAGSILFSQVESLLEDEEEESKSSQVKEAVRQVKKATKGEKLGPDGKVNLDNDEAGAEEVTEEDEDDIVPEEQPDDALFIPCGWPQKKPREYYKGTDPEWQSFHEFALNAERMRHVKGT